MILRWNAKVCCVSASCWRFRWSITDIFENGAQSGFFWNTQTASTDAWTHKVQFLVMSHSLSMHIPCLFQLPCVCHARELSLLNLLNFFVQNVQLLHRNCNWRQLCRHVNAAWQRNHGKKKRLRQQKPVPFVRGGGSFNNVNGTGLKDVGTTCPPSWVANICISKFLVSRFVIAAGFQILCLCMR